MTNVVVTITQRKAPQRRWCGIFRSLQGLSVCLLIESTQKTLHGMVGNYQANLDCVECAHVFNEKNMMFYRIESLQIQIITDNQNGYGEVYTNTLKKTIQ